MIQIENTWVQKKVVPNLNIQVLYMDGPYLPAGEDRIIEEYKEENNKNVDYTSGPYIISKVDGKLVELGYSDPDATIYCFFDYSIDGIKYSKSEEFTNLFNSASQVLSYAIGIHGVSKTVKLK